MRQIANSCKVWVTTPVHMPELETLDSAFKPDELKRMLDRDESAGSKKRRFPTWSRRKTKV